jgi:CYTH domain-containing protein
MAADRLEIERKFLVKHLPPGIEHARTLPIAQGYIVLDDTREVRLRWAGSAHTLTVKEGEGLARREVETPISRRQFDTLWPLTEGRRIEKIRSIIEHGALRIEIDRYAGDLDPLCVAEIEFPTIDASERFVKPAFLGNEVTERADYKNAWLAVHGIPPLSEVEYRIGALPYLIRGGRLHVVLITNSSQTRWLIPKGQPESGMSRQDVGLMESFEEAGVIGNFLPGLRAQCKLKDQTTLHLYPLKVSTLLHTWPESRARKRAVLPLDKAVKTISDKSLAQCIQRLAAKLTA